MYAGCDFLSGWAAGVAGLIVGHPLDTIKVRQQTFKNNRLVSVILNTYKYEGFGGFYRGLLFPLLAAGTQSCIFFGTYGNILRILQRNKSDYNVRKFCCENGKAYYGWHFHVGIAGAIGGAATAIITCPVELIKIQLQIMTDPIQGTSLKAKCRDGIMGSFQCAKSIYNIGGIRSLYTGGAALLMRDIPGFSIYILSYEHVLCLLQDKIEPGHHTKFRYDIAAGGVAGIISWLLMPFDVVKSRLQGDNLKNPVYKGVLDCFIKSYKQNGFSIFMQGFWVCALRAFPTNAVTFAVYEYCISRCQNTFTRYL